MFTEINNFFKEYEKEQALDHAWLRLKLLLSQKKALKLRSIKHATQLGRDEYRRAII